MGADDVLAAIEKAYAESFSRFYRVAFAILREREAAWDAVQEGFANAIRSRHGFRRDAPLEAWLWRVVVNEALAAGGRPRPDELGEDVLFFEQESPVPAEVSGLVGALPPRQRLVLFLRFYADLDYRTIGEVAGISVGTVSATLHAALAALRRELEVSR